MGMKNLILILAFWGFCGSASAQWAVLDQSVLDVVEEIRDTATGKKDLSKFADQAALDSVFESISLADPKKYIGTEEDCMQSGSGLAFCLYATLFNANLT
jgi:hypothetical protein